MLIDLTIALERILLAEMERERSLMSDETLAQTIGRRILMGAAAIDGGLIDQLEWHPISTRAERLTLFIATDAADALEAVCRVTAFAPEVVVAAFVASDLCTPTEVLTIEGAHRLNSPTVRAGPLRRERGKGNIYRAYFDVPGYQLAFILTLGRGPITQSAVIEEALLALARQVRVTRRFGPVAISTEAHELADRMVSMAATKTAKPTSFRRRYSSRASA